MHHQTQCNLWKSKLENIKQLPLSSEAVLTVRVLFNSLLWILLLVEKSIQLFEKSIQLFEKFIQLFEKSIQLFDNLYLHLDNVELHPLGTRLNCCFYSKMVWKDDSTKKDASK